MRLCVAELKSLHQSRLWVFLFSDDLDDDINIEICDQQAIKDMESLYDPLQTVSESTLDRIQAELKPFF